MARYVWTCDYHYDDGPEGGEDLGIFTSKRKAMKEAREHSGRSRLTWRASDDGDDHGATPPTMFIAECEEMQDDGYGGQHPYSTRYYVQRRVVR